MKLATSDPEMLPTRWQHQLLADLTRAFFPVGFRLPRQSRYGRRSEARSHSRNVAAFS